MFARSKEVDGDLLRVMEDDELEEHVGLDGLMVKKLRKKMVRGGPVAHAACSAHAHAHTRTSVRKTHTHERERERVCVCVRERLY